MREAVRPLGALRRSGRLAMSVLEALPGTTVAVLDRDLRFVLTAGDSLGVFGSDPHGLEGRRLADIVQSRFTTALEPRLRAAMRGESVGFVHSVPEGADVYDVTLTPVELHGEIAGCTVIARDITAQRAAESALDDREHMYRELADYSSDVVTRSNEHGIFQYVSPSARKVYGWEPEQMVGRSVFDFIHPDDHALHAAIRADLTAGAAEHVAELRLRSAAGGWVWVELNYTVLRKADGSVREVQGSARDITDRKTAEAARRTADAQFRTAFDGAPIGTALVAPHGTLLRVNDALCEIVGYTRDELLHTTLQEITHPDDVDADVASVRHVLAERISSYRVEKRLVRRDGEAVWAQLAVSLVRDEAGRPLHFVSHVEDISDRKRLEAELHRLATHDHLTGLRNRRWFEHELETQLRRVRRYGEEASVLVIDLDEFKSVNDTFGHHAGDALLKHVGAVLSEHLRATDVVARLGGDEFAVLLPRTDHVAASTVSRALEDELARHPVRIDDTHIFARASIGVAPVEANGSVGDVLRRADRTMYNAKHAHRN
jgi:diguanylate cyclase (GGDEF)-like protein/PAS domain S-box-containing protein